MFDINYTREAIDTTSNACKEMSRKHTKKHVVLLKSWQSIPKQGSVTLSP